MKRGPRPAGRDGRATRHYRPRPGSGARARIVSRCDQCGAVAGVQFDPADPIASERAMDMLSRAQAAHCRQSCEGATFSDGRPPEPATATPTHGATHGAKRGQRS